MHAHVTCQPSDLFFYVENRQEGGTQTRTLTLYIHENQNNNSIAKATAHVAYQPATAIRKQSIRRGASSTAHLLTQTPNNFFAAGFPGMAVRATGSTAKSCSSRSCTSTLQRSRPPWTSKKGSGVRTLDGAVVGGRVRRTSPNYLPPEHSQMSRNRGIVSGLSAKASRGARRAGCVILKQPSFFPSGVNWIVRG